MSMEPVPSYWRKCTTCKKTIGFGQKYWVCSVSTCNRIRVAMVFCDLGCFDAHVPVMNHKDAGAFEKRAPTASEWNQQQEAEKAKAAASSHPASQAQAAQSKSTGSASTSSTGTGNMNAGATQSQSPRQPQTVLRRPEGSSGPAIVSSSTPAPSSTSATSLATGLSSNSSPASTGAAPSIQASESEILVVVSKVKDYIRRKSGMNTSENVMETLSRKIRIYANDAIRKASQDGRKTVLDRDFKF